MRMLERKALELSADDRDALIEALMDLVDFGEAIREKHVKFTARKCLRLTSSMAEARGLSGQVT